MDQLQFRKRIASAETKTFYLSHRASKNMSVDIRYNLLEHYVTRQEKQTICGQCDQRATSMCRKCNIAVNFQALLIITGRKNKYILTFLFS